MSRIEEHLRKTFIQETPNEIFYPEEAIRKQLSSIDPFLDESTTSEERARFKQDVYTKMTNSAQHLTQPEQEFAPVPPELTKHFMMVAPLHPSLPFNPTQFIEQYAKWATLKNALVASGAQVTVIDPREKKKPVHFFCRDGFSKIQNVILLPDQNEAAHEIEAMANSRPDLMSIVQELMGTNNFISLKDKKAEYERLEHFLENSDERIGLLQEISLDGGNVISDPITKSVFVGLKPSLNPIDIRYNKEIIEALQKVIKKMVGSEWAVYDVPIKEDNLTRAQYEQYQNAVLQDPGQAQILYHLDLGMSEPLQNGEILICPDITTPEKYQQIKDILGANRIIEVTREEALNMSTNLVQHGSNIIMSKASNRLRGILQEKGYHVFDAKDFGLKNFVIMDSGPHCLTNELTPSLG